MCMKFNRSYRKKVYYFMRGLRDVRSMHLIHQDCLEWFYCLIKAFY